MSDEHHPKSKPPSPTPPPDGFLTVLEAATIARVDQKTIRKWMKHHGLVFVQPMSRTTRIPRLELNAFLTRKRTQK